MPGAQPQHSTVLRATGVAYNEQCGTVKQVRRKTSYLALLVSVVAVYVSLIAVRDAPIEEATKTPSSVSIMPQIDECVAKGDTDSSCLQSWLTAGVAVIGVKDTLLEFDDFLKKYPNSIRNCHEPSHALGSAVWASRRELGVGELFALGGETCLMGYVHGILESLAQEKPDKGELVKVFSACKESYEESGTAQLCYDGIGHAAWSAYSEIEQAVGVCSEAAEAMDRRSCETGIVMQIFKPAHLKASKELSENMSEATDLCNDWPMVPTKDGSDPARGCWDGVAYLIHEKLSTRWFEEGSEKVSDDLEVWVERFKEASAVCDDLGRGAGLCFQNLGRYIMLPWTGFNWEVAETMCLTNSAHAMGCLWEAANGAMNYGVVAKGDVREYLVKEGHSPGDFKWSA